MTHVDKAWRNEWKVAPHTHKDTFTICDTQQLIESQNTWNAAPFIDGAEISGFPLISQQGSVLGRVRKYLLLFTWTYRFGKCKFSAILSHTCLDQKKSKRLLHLHYLIAPSLNLLVWYCLGDEKTWLRGVWIHFLVKLFAISVGGLCCCTGTPESAKLLHPKWRLTRKC